MNKFLLLIAGALIVLAAFLFALMQYYPAEQVQTSISYSAADFVWKTEPLGSDASWPLQRLTLTAAGKSYAVGEYLNCDARQTVPEETGKISYMSCWWGGGGHELAVFEKNGIYTVEERTLSESGGPEVSAPPYSPWKILFEIK